MFAVDEHCSLLCNVRVEWCKQCWLSEWSVEECSLASTVEQQGFYSCLGVWWHCGPAPSPTSPLSLKSARSTNPRALFALQIIACSGALPPVAFRNNDNKIARCMLNWHWDWVDRKKRTARDSNGPRVACKRELIELAQKAV